jgi:hypothetical protein
MKLAEALVQRADVQKRIEQLRKRIKAGAQVQEGEEPPENPPSRWPRSSACSAS